jgi:hypothetical protein
MFVSIAAAARALNGEHGNEDKRYGDAGLLPPRIPISHLQSGCERDPQCEANCRRKPHDPGATA